MIGWFINNSTPTRNSNTAKMVYVKLILHNNAAHSRYLMFMYGRLLCGHNVQIHEDEPEKVIAQ